MSDNETHFRQLSATIDIWTGERGLFIRQHGDEDGPIYMFEYSDLYDEVVAFIPFLFPQVQAESHVADLLYGMNEVAKELTEEDTTP